MNFVKVLKSVMHQRSANVSPTVEPDSVASIITNCTKVNNRLRIFEFLLSIDEQAIETCSRVLSEKDLEMGISYTNMRQLSQLIGKGLMQSRMILQRTLH